MKVVLVLVVAGILGHVQQVRADSWSDRVSQMNCVNKRLELVQELNMVGYRNDYAISDMHRHPERFKSHQEFMAMYQAIVEDTNNRSQQIIAQIKHHNNVCKQ